MYVFQTILTCISSINYLTGGGSSALATDQFSYDGDLRPITDTANWQSGSGNGTAAIFSQSRSFDPVGNLTSLTTTQAGIPNLNGSGGTETSNFCYDEQNRLVWAGNSGKQPGAGNGTCGSGILASGLTGASYSNTYLYTHLGQLYQAPLNGSGTQEQYLYCGSSATAPHQLTGLYPTSSGATCSNYTKLTADYSSSYDAFGNVTSRTTGGTTATLSYDLLDHLTRWYVSATNQEQYIYDASGNRILRRSTTSSGTTMTVYAFGLEDHTYTGSGTNQGNTYYYSLAGRLIGSNDANGTVFYITDTLGSILASFTNTAGGAALKGNQVFGPYGNARYSAGSINTSKGFTGQYNDSLTGLDYYNARYYDPVAGVFLSADVKQGNAQGMNPYAYVGGNPETENDPTGLRPIQECPSGDCNAPVDMAALSVAINIWANENQPSLSQCGPQPEPAPVAQSGIGPILPNSPQWHQIGSLVAFGYLNGNAIVTESVDEAFRLRQYSWSDDGGVSLNQLIAYQLAITAQEWRREFQRNPVTGFGFAPSNNVGNGFYYVTDANGNLVTRGVQDPINGYNSKDDPSFGFNHSEQRLIRDFKDQVIPGLSANGQLQAGDTLHYVLFTQFKPCGISCSKSTFAADQQEMQKLSGPGVNIDFSVWTSAQYAGIPVTSARMVYQYYP